MLKHKIKSYLKLTIMFVIALIVMPYLSCQSTTFLITTVVFCTIGLFGILLDIENPLAINVVALTVPTVVIIAIVLLIFNETIKLKEYKVHNIELFEQSYTVCGLDQSNKIQCADVSENNFIKAKYLLKSNPTYNLTFVDYVVKLPCGAVPKYYTKIKELK